jgi:DNA invertase Pin-like site-specific DNA recombinase
VQSGDLPTTSYSRIVRSTLDTGRALFTDSLSCRLTISSYFGTVVTSERGTTCTIWSVDRLGRSLTDLLDFLREPHAKGVDLFLHQQGLDTSTPSGRAMFQMMGVFAEFERAMIRERVLAGLARAKEQGISLGRRRLEECDAAKLTAIKRALAAKQGVRSIARDLKAGVGTVLRIKSELAA